MELTELVNLVVNNSLAIGITIYFLWRDAKYQSALLEAITTLKNAVENMRQILDDLKP